MSFLLRAYIFAKIKTPEAPSVVALRYVASCELLAFRGPHLGVDLDDAANNHQLALVRNIQPAAWLKEKLTLPAGKQSENTKLGRALAKQCPGWLAGMHKHGVEVSALNGKINTMWASALAPGWEWKDEKGNGTDQQTNAAGRQGTGQPVSTSLSLTHTLCVCVLVLFVRLRASGRG
jgi:hypothetical protein